ncbi:MAG: biotin/lipoyl-binding protein, partial [Acidobacteriaceae bacterium]
MPTPRRKNKRSRWIWLTVAAGLVILFYFIRMATRSRVPVRTAVVQRSELKSTIPTNGKVEPQGDFEAHAPYPGVVKALYVQEGQKVAAGKLLLRMNDADARARLATALAGVKGAEAGYDAMLQG